MQDNDADEASTQALTLMFPALSFKEHPLSVPPSGRWGGGDFLHQRRQHDRARVRSRAEGQTGSPFIQYM